MNPPAAPQKVLSVCLGNICRSPTVEAVLRAKASEAGLPLTVDSAGTAGYHVGSAPDHRSIRHARARCYELAHLRARKVQLSDFEQFDLILAADESNLSDLRRICPQQYTHKLALFLENQPLPDPYHGDEHDFEHVLDLVERRAEALIRHWVSLR
ncbi:MAG: hypothetical protein RLZZ399_52 [Verrucomicrobiota bacterium]|jgi:protein-tyrosine phosphatase